MLETFRSTLASLIAPPKKRRAARKLTPKTLPAKRPDMSLARMYAAAKQSRLNQGWGQTTGSEDTELIESLVKLRDRSRETCRDSSYAKRAKIIVQNNVVGSGIGMQARIMTTRYALKEPLNLAIETAWEQWSKGYRCHTGKTLHFCEFERQVMGQVFEAGEVFIRKHYSAVGDSRVPLALEIIESERINDTLKGTPTVGMPNVRMGVELDQFQAPLAYHILSIHPNEIRFTPDKTIYSERVPARDIIHLRIIDRWPQTRGVPWLHAALRRLNDMDGLGEAEIVASRAAACYMGFIKMPNAEVKYGDKQPDGSTMSELSPALIERLNPGEDFVFAAPNRPNAQLDPFMRLMLREVAAGVGSSYESLSRDYSQSNYSSSRLALLDDRDLWRMLQRWFIRSFREPLYNEWLTLAVMAGAIEDLDVLTYGNAPERFQAVRFKPRGWNWVDPTKEVQAYKDAVRCGFTTVSRVIEQTGNGDDLEDILTEREEELAWMKEKKLIFDTDPSVKADGSPAEPEEKAPAAGGSGQSSAGASAASQSEDKAHNGNGYHHAAVMLQGGF
jgi:lambda family phage portal protein